MNPEYRNKDLTQLCDLLVEKTMQLMRLMELKTEPENFRGLKEEVEEIQSAIQARKSNHAR